MHLKCNFGCDGVNRSCQLAGADQQQKETRMCCRDLISVTFLHFEPSEKLIQLGARFSKKSFHGLQDKQMSRCGYKIFSFCESHTLLPYNSPKTGTSQNLRNTCICLKSQSMYFFIRTRFMTANWQNFFSDANN